MSESGEVLVIGGGVVGVCSAYFMARRGQRVRLVEQGEIAVGSSYANNGFICPSHSTPLASPGALADGLRWMLDPESPFYIKPRLSPDLLSWLVRFSLSSNEQHVREAVPLLRHLGGASIALYDEFASLDELSFGYERRGLLLVYKTPKGLAHGAAEANMVAGVGIASVVLNEDDARALEPTLRPGIAGAVHYPGDAHLNPAEFVRGLAALAEKHGARIHTNTEVMGFETSGRRVTAVRTTRGDFHPEQVVLAAGSWSPVLVRDLRLKVPIQPAKGYSITVKRPAAMPSVPMLLGESRVAVTPLGSLLRFGGTLELAGMDLTINRRRVEAILRAAREHLVGMDELETVEIWRGLRPATPDGLPIIGRAKSFDNLVLAAGHATIGMSLGPVTGQLVSQVICGEPPMIDLAPLRLERFG